MSDTREIVVRIKNASQNANTTIIENNGLDKIQSDIDKQQQEQINAFKNYATTQIIDFAKAGVGNAISYYASNVGNLTGDIGAVHTVQQLQNAYEWASDIYSIGRGAVIGATAGSIIPVVGTAVGAIIGASAELVGVGFKRTNQAIQYKMQVASDNRSVMLNQIRSGGEKSNWSR